LESEYPDVQNGARALLLKHFPNQLDYKALLGFLESVDPGVRDGARALLLKHFPDCAKQIEKKLLAEDVLKSFS